MAKFKGKGVVVAGLIAGVASFLSKKENRNMVMEYLGQAKGKSGALQNNEKVQSLLDKALAKSGDTSVDEMPIEQNLEDIAATAADTSTTIIDGNQMVGEGAQTTVNYFNEEMQEGHEQKPY